MNKFFNYTRLLFNDDPENTGGGSGEPDVNTATPPEGNSDTTQSNLDFIPEAYKQSSWATKYNNSEDFFKGIDNMQKMLGQKQVVSGIIKPSSDDKPEVWEKFYNDMGRPETPDLYSLESEINIDQIDMDAERKAFSAVMHKNGVSPEQAKGIFNDYLTNIKESIKTEDLTQDQIISRAFTENPSENFEMAKNASKALGFADKLDEEGLSENPIVLQLLAEIGSRMGEDSFIEGKTGSLESAEEILAEAKRIQMTPEYRYDPEVYKKVEKMYQMAFKKK